MARNGSDGARVAKVASSSAMSAPSADFSAPGASTSSSGFSDGLGRRTLAFDREDGTMLERLVVRAELSAFERGLRERLERLAVLDDERLQKPRSIERGPDGSLVVLSEFVPGTRLSELLDAIAQQGTVPGVDVALGFLLDVLPALCGLHAGAGFCHGAISPGRTVLTPAGQVVLLDAIYAEALTHLQYSRRRLWTEFGIAMPPAVGHARFDAAADVAQAALSALTLIIGRPVAEEEYPDGIAPLLVEVVEVAQIRASTEFASGLQRFFQHSLPLPGRRPYTTVDDALIAVRDLARQLGLDVCRRALLEFIEQQDGDTHTVPSGFSYQPAEGYEFDTDETYESGTNGDGTTEGDTDEDPFEVDLDRHLDAVAEPENDAVYDLNSGGDLTSTEQILETPSDSFGADTFESDHRSSLEPAPADAFVPAPIEEEARHETIEPASPVADAFVPAPPEPEPSPAPAETLVSEPIFASRDEFLAASAPTESTETSAAVSSIEEDFDEPQSSTETDTYEETITDDPKGSRRRKKSRSVRSRKDKLRSTARPEPLAPPPSPLRPAPPPAPAAPVAAAPPAKASGGWLIEPPRPSSFEPPVPTPARVPEPLPAPKPVAPPVVFTPPSAPAWSPPPPPPAPVPLVVTPPPVPKPIVVVPVAPPIPLQRMPIVAPPAPSTSTVKLKNDGFAAPKKTRPEPVEDIYSTRKPFEPPIKETPAIPWKLAGGVLGVLVVGSVAARALLFSASGAPATKPAADVPPPVAATAPAAVPKTGKIQVETQPPGAKVFLNGKPAGESPLTLEVPAGKHTLTLASSSGSVRRPVRVEAGKTVTIDVPIYSGWVDVAAPIIFDVSEDGKSIGTTEQNRLLLKPGRHELTFTNRDLDYTSTHVVEVEPGEAKTLTIDPRGSVNFNATPWAEVWVDGKKVGETPLANLQLPLGTHEIVFKHPQFGERRMTTTMRANAPVALSIDMSKP